VTKDTTVNVSVMRGVVTDLLYSIAHVVLLNLKMCNIDTYGPVNSDPNVDDRPLFIVDDHGMNKNLIISLHVARKLVHDC
jgi:hypothetical protein